ncbi:MAG: hypothetical protein LQ344_006891 [Seirophora lacunosa]|nr:MAG: hypothetical protein LQ344_006891 [Seirophora lacunosa]
MRELATQKLSDAYHRDEIAASVAAMQSASSVDEVAKLVLQRNGSDIDARYVNFFHEKIPSRMFAESTSLDVLDDIIRSRPADVALLRTRAVTRVFKGDLTAAAVDLSKALAIIRSTATQHIVPRSETGPLTVLRSALKTENSRSCNDEIEAGDEDRPSSLKPQLLFQRAGIYLALACQNIATYLDSLSSSADLPTVSDSTRSNFQRNENSFSTQAHSYSSEARKLTKSYAKRALRDYISFLSFLEYTPGFPATAVDEDEADSGKKIPGSEQSAASIRGEPQKSVNQGARDEATLPEALTPYDVEAAGSQNGRTMSGYRPPKLFPLSDLFAAIPPSDLPTYPVASSQIIKHSWDTLCDNVPSTSDFKGDQEEETQAQARGRIRQEAIMDSLADERVNDEATFQVAVTSREREVEALEGGFHLFERNQDVSPHLHQGVRDEFPVCSERAEAIARWVNEAPRSTTWSGRSKRCGKGEGTGVMSTTAEART